MAKRIRRKKWKEEEDRYLEKMWGKSSAKTMSARLGRSVKAIDCRARKLGLGRAIDNVEGIPMIMIPEIVGVSYDTIWKIWVGNHGLEYKKVGKNIAYVEEDNLVEFMRTHVNLWDARKCDKYYFYTYDWFNELLENERNGIHTNRYHRYTQQEDARIVFLHEVKGMSYRAIGKEFGVCQQAIHKRYKKIKKGA